MTHFTVGIIIPQNQSDIKSYIADQMEPYDEALAVEPYVCYSLDQAAADIAGTIHRLELIIARNEPHYDIAKCREELEKLRATTPEQKYRDHLQYHEDFNDRGEPLSTFNPKGKWDWYVVGGRWDGWINDQETSDGSIRDNTAKTEQAIAGNKIPRVIITPDGEWHERGKTGWFGTLLTENENWNSDAKAILARYPGYHVVIVDAHV